MASSLHYCHDCGAANSVRDAICFACGRTLKQSLDEAEQDVLLQKRYRILKQVGTGGFGAVYKAADMQNYGRIVAIKQINLRGLKALETIEATDGFNREVQLLSRLAHAHLPRIRDHFTDTDHWYLVMDFIDGETLEQYLRDIAVSSLKPTAGIRILQFAEVLDIAQQLCTVLDFLHTRQPPIIFRDLKPANIMRTQQGKLYLIDFGIARRYKPGQAKDTMPFGSPGYAAPEQYGKAQTTPRADIYSLGALLYHLLSQQDPAESPFSFAPLRQYGAAGRAELEALVQRMVALDTKQRPESIQEVASELERIEALHNAAEPRIWRPTQGATPSDAASTAAWQSDGAYGQGGAQSMQQAMYRPTVQTVSSRRNFLLGGLAVGGLVMLGALTQKMQRHQQPYTGPSQTFTMLIQEEAYSLSSEHVGHANGIACSPMEARFASISDDGNARIWAVDSMQPEDTFLVGTGNGNDIWHSVSWSASGDYLAVAADKRVQVWDIAKHMPIFDTTSQQELLSGKVQMLAWSPKKDYLAVENDRGSVTIVQIDPQQEVQNVIYTHNSNHTHKIDTTASFSWSPDGQRIASPDPENGVQVWDAIDGEHLTLYARKYAGNEAAKIVTTIAWSPDGAYIASANRDRIVSIQDITNVNYEHNLFLPGEGMKGINALGWSADSKYLGAAFENKIYAWDMTSDREQPALLYYSATPSTDIRSFAWSPQATGHPTIVAVSGDGQVHVWKTGLSHPNDVSEDDSE